MHENSSSFSFAHTLDSVTKVESLDALASLIAALRTLYGVQQVSYTTLHLGGLPRAAPGIALHTFSQDWSALYKRQNYMDIDPVFVEARRSPLPLDWDSIDRGSPRIRTFFAEAEQHGIGRKGCTIPIANRYGDMATFTFTADLPDEAWTRFRREREAELAFLGWHIHERAMTLSGHRESRVLPGLSAQEQRCLDHLIQAKSAKAIARDMDLSVSTVRMHLNNARLKLGSKTLPQAVAVAVRRGLLLA